MGGFRLSPSWQCLTPPNSRLEETEAWLLSLPAVTGDWLTFGDIHKWPLDKLQFLTPALASFSALEVATPFKIGHVSLLIGSIQLCPETFCSVPVDNTPWKLKMNWEVPLRTNTHLQISHGCYFNHSKTWFFVVSFVFTKTNIKCFTLQPQLFCSYS